MATYTAKCWLGQNAGYQQLEVQANTLEGAYEQFESIYNAEQIINCRKVSSDYDSSDSGNTASYLFLALAVVFIWLLIEYWWIVVPVAAIIFILKFIQWTKSL